MYVEIFSLIGIVTTVVIVICLIIRLWGWYESIEMLKYKYSNTEREGRFLRQQVMEHSYKFNKLKYDKCLNFNKKRR